MPPGDMTRMPTSSATALLIPRDPSRGQILRRSGRRGRAGESTGTSPIRRVASHRERSSTRTCAQLLTTECPDAARKVPVGETAVAHTMKGEPDEAIYVILVEAHGGAVVRAASAPGA